ncbi:acyl-CoA carboxylase subunit epsilon [Nigerium massiliense]|uniref:acyl-CoA carboxylase subunit epsilon n=1 Tax=Nigerium massiliense TaxID=1522317 RepID=UPI00058CA16B|nr:acyl-CoA carboxylase subunit epsilon [Nigerium massiliense]
MTAQAEQAPGPAFRVVGGNPTDEELAALAVVLSSLRRERGRPHAPENRAQVSGWKSYWANVRQPFYPGRDAWRATIRR